MKGIMFVCTGNICRSAMAHHYFQKKIKDLNRDKELFVSSCGTSAFTGDKSTKNAIEVMKKYGVNLTKHTATSMFDLDVENYDLILCMTEEHKYNFLAYFPKLKEKVFTLKEYVYGDKIKNSDIKDPWGRSLKVYDNCAKEIVECVNKLLEKI